MQHQPVLTSVILCLTLAGQLLADDDSTAPCMPAGPEKCDFFSDPVPLTNRSLQGGMDDPDGYGYTYIDSTDPNGPIYNFIDISGSGTPIALGDDAGSSVVLGFTFNFYGRSYTNVELASNGYLTFGTENDDPTNACFPGNFTSPPNSIYAYWDDLDPGDDDANAYSQNFGACPVGDVTACTIFQWEEFDFSPGDGVPGGTAGTFQTVLYDNGKILLQYEGGPGLDGTSATIGLWEESIANRLIYSCDSAEVSAGLAILFDAGPLGDLAIVKTGDVAAGGPFDYTISVENLGPENQTDVVVTDVLSPEIAYVSDDCGGSFVAGTWTWSIGELDVGFSDTCKLTVELTDPHCLGVANTATVIGDLVDLVGNNSSTTTDGGGNTVADPGFEGGAPNDDWIEASSNFGTPLCSLEGCGFGTGTGPRSGDWWAWFGGIGAPEEGRMTQDVVLSTASTTLTFWLEAIVCDSAADFLEVTIDGDQVAFYDGTADFCGTLGYHQEVVDISAFADGGTHTLEFHSQVFAVNGFVTNFFVDDVKVQLCPGGNCATDFGFEAGSPNPFWAEASTNFETPLCTINLCGFGTGTGPRSGDWWTWFGGIGAPEKDA